MAAFNQQGQWNYVFTRNEYHPGDVVKQVRFSPDGQLVAACSIYDSRIHLWSVDNGELACTLYEPCGSVNDIAFSADGESLAAACEDKKVRLWSIRRRKIVTTMEGHGGEVRCVAFSKDKRRLASASDDETIRLWGTVGIRSGDLIEELKPSSSVRSLAFYPYDSPYILISAANDGRIQLWKAEDGQHIETLNGPHSMVFDMSISSDSRFLALAACNQVHLWNLPEKKYLGAITDSSGFFIWCVAFDPCGGILASGHENGTVQLYDLTSATIDTLRGHTERVLSVAYSNDGQFLATGSEDTTVRLWRRNN